ncbi:MAG TPA: response regulator [Candidatus Sulfotelmatobacter sp.]|nr:response regulator [Candidatus Sulfotelmatobacter sp.]
MPARHLLSVDDDPEILKQRKLLLEANGYSVSSATSGREALKLLQEKVLPDLILTDYAMPGMNGDELARRVRESYPGVPLVAVSAINPLPEGFRGLVDGSVPKGQEPQILLAEIAAVLERSGKNHETKAVKRTVLCVEDEELQLQARRMLFEASGYRVLTARSVREAMEAFTHTEVDAVVMDYWLSDQEGNGTALAERMKRLRPRTPIVMLSGFTALPGEGALVDAWMRKAQMEPEKLVGEVDRVIELRNLRAQNDNSR